MIKQTEEKKNLKDEKYYIDKSGALEWALQEYSCVYLEGAAASGKSTAIRMLCQRQERESILMVSAHKESLEEYSYKISMFREESFRSGKENVWIVIEEFPGEPTESELSFILSLVPQLKSEERLIIEAREEIPESFLDLLWKGSIQILSQDTLTLSESEVAFLTKKRNSFLNPSEVFEKTGGWAGCVDLLLRMTSNSSHGQIGWRSVSECLQRREVKEYLDKQIIQTLRPDEKEILRYMEFCPWMEPSLCEDVFGIPDAKHILESLGRKGVLTRHGKSGIWQRTPLFDVTNNDFSKQKSIKLRKAGAWFSENAFPEQALFCFLKTGDKSGYDDCLRLFYTAFPFSKMGLPDDLPADTSSESCYLRGMKAVFTHDWETLEKECHQVETQMKDNKNATEIWLNLTFANPMIPLENWMKALSQKAKMYGPFRLYHILGGSCTFLCGLRDLSGLFAVRKAVERKYTECWKNSLKSEEWKAYQLARIDFYVETKQQEKLSENDWELLFDINEEESWELLLAKYWLLIKVRRLNLSKGNEDIEESIRSVLEREENPVCQKLLETMDALRKDNGGERILFTWMKDKKSEEKNRPILEDSVGMWYLRVAALFEIQQYDRMEIILKKLIPFVRSGRRTRLLAECLFQQAVVNRAQGNRKNSLQDTVESFLVTGQFRYFRFYTCYGKNGYDTIADYIEWINVNASENWNRKRKYNYGNILNMPQQDYLNTILREAKKKNRQIIQPSPEGTEETLTVTEIIVLKELSTGRTNEEICEDLNLKLTTVKGHLYSIYKKLGVKSRVQALLIGKERGLIGGE